MVRILVTTFHDYDIGLRHHLVSNLVNMKNIEVTGLEKLCDDLNIYYDPLTPRDTINRVISSLSDYNRHNDTITLLLLDEVPPTEVGQRNPDWLHLEVGESVIWLLGLSPRAPLARSTKILPPLNNFVLSYHLIHKHRNSCRKRGWQHQNSGNISGCEARCVVLLDCRLSPELITRGVNVLIIINR